MKDREIAKICNFTIKDNNVFLKKDIENKEKEGIYNIFMKNIKKITFLGLILPCASFLFIFLVSTLLIAIKANKGKIENDVFNETVFLFFISILFLILGLILSYKIVKRNKCYLTINNKALQYKYISKEEYNKICDFLKKGTKYE